MLSNTADEVMDQRWIPKNSKLKQEIDSLVRRSREFTEFRNQVAHGAWQYKVGGNPKDVKLMLTKEKDEKLYVRVHPHLSTAFIHKQCAQVK